MVVEQRIGRLDRIGQQSPAIVILNLIVQNSIEERVLKRLLNKIRIFRESIGELDTIVGEEIERITRDALRGELLPDELEKLVEQEGDAIQLRVIEAKQMLSRVDGLLAADQALIDEINAVVGERQLPSERELLLFLNLFLAARFPGCQLPKEIMRDVVRIDLRGPLATVLENSMSDLGTDAVLFGRRIATGLVEVTLCARLDTVIPELS